MYIHALIHIHTIYTVTACTRNTKTETMTYTHTLSSIQPTLVVAATHTHFLSLSLCLSLSHAHTNTHSLTVVIACCRCRPNVALITGQRNSCTEKRKQWIIFGLLFSSTKMMRDFSKVFFFLNYILLLSFLSTIGYCMFIRSQCLMTSLPSCHCLIFIMEKKVGQEDVSSERPYVIEFLWPGGRVEDKILMFVYLFITSTILNSNLGQR